MAAVTDQQTPRTRTRDHRWVELWLDRNGIGYQSECIDFPPKQVDIYIGEWHLAVEIDGPNHSPGPDAERDKFLLERYGLPTLRVDTTRIAWKSAVQVAIVKFIEEYASSTRERMALWRGQ